MPESERSVLHVLPHPGGGGETYVDLLGGMPGYRFDRAFLSPESSPSPVESGRRLLQVTRRARHHDLLHVHGEIAGGLCLGLLATRPSVVTLHGLHLVRRTTGLGRTAAVFNLRAVLHAADCTICVSESEQQRLIDAVGPGAARHAVVIRNGVRIPPPRDDADRAAVRTELGIERAAPVAIWIGSLDERKDPLVAVRAAQRASVALLVVGDGPLRAQVARAATGAVDVLGRRRDVPRLLGAADLFVLTSRREGLALSLLEAMAHGLAPVITRLPENVEAVGETGVAVPAGDVNALEAALRRLAGDASAREALGARARQRVVELFDADAMTRRTRAVYDSVLADRRDSETARERS